MLYTANESRRLYHANFGTVSNTLSEYLYELEDRFPVCGMGMIENPEHVMTALVQRMIWAH